MNLFSLLAEGFDLPVLDWIAEHLWCPALDFLMPKITLLGDAGIFWMIIAAALLLFRKTRRTGVGMLLALLMGLLLCNLTLKPLCQRPRPYDYQYDVFGRVIPLIIERQHDFSFPSGHTIASFEAAGVIVMNNKKWGAAALVLACLIAFSRMYLYVHYPTDVLTSVVLGLILAF
ncbi:MAG: phosphatase PAP2 family protein, partial [Oscillospiraceae bacterium]|nr:phosphatase PAP2 family protein [Oscillospiraceae bacterium]